MFKSSITSLASRAPMACGRRAFHASPMAQKTVTEKVSEVADKVNKKVGQGLASAIDTGEKVSNVAKDTISSKSEEAKGQAAKAEGAVKKAGHDAKAKAKETKAEVEKEL